MLETTITAEQITEVRNTVVSFVKNLCELVKNIIEKLISAFRTVISKNPRHCHLLRYAKKPRTRKKYANKILRETHRIFFKLMEG